MVVETTAPSSIWGLRETAGREWVSTPHLCLLLEASGFLTRRNTVSPRSLWQ